MKKVTQQGVSRMKGDGSVGMRTKGEVMGGGTEKTEEGKEKERDCHFNLPCGCLFRHQSAHFQKGPVKEGTLCPLPPG